MKNFIKWTIVLFCFVLTLNCILLPSSTFAAEMDFIESLSGDKLTGKLNQPFSLFVSERKNRLYIADTANNRLISFDSELNFLAEFDAGGSLKHPTGLVKNSYGQFIVIEGNKNELMFIDIPKKIYRPFKVTGIPIKANPVFFGRLAIDKSDNLFLTDRGNGRILVLNSEGQYMKEIMFNDQPVDFSDIRVDENGNIYSLSTLKGSVFIFNKKGDLISKFGKRGYGKEELLFPISIAVGSDGLIYVLDQHKGSVLVFQKDGKFQFSFSKKGWGAGELYLPSYIYADRDGKIYIADRGNNRVQVFKNSKK